MTDQDKTKEQLISELGELRQRVAELEAVETERRRAEEALWESEERFRSIIKLSNDSIVLTDEQGIIIEWNRGAEQIFGLKPDEVLGRLIWDVQFQVAPEERRTPTLYEELKASILELLRTGQASWMGRLLENEFQHSDGERRVMESSVFPIKTKRGFMIGSISRDITERMRAEEQIRASLREKWAMLAEIHHRVRNNLQIIASLLNFQATFAQDGQIGEALHEIQNRVRSMALIHEQLYQAPDLAQIDFADYVQTLTASLFAAYCVDPVPVITLQLDMQDVFLEIKEAVPCGLLINELVSNALMHAFPVTRDWPQGFTGEISVSFRTTGEGEYTLVVSDNGIGLPIDFEFPTEDTLGLLLVGMLVRQLGGSVEWAGDGGTTCRVTFEA
jgi:PAS domain S-box-containing protein